MALKVNVENLVASGVTVTGHGEDLAMKHCVADTRIETAQGGWRGQSAQAMTLRLTAWSTTTTVLLTQLSEHAQGLHACAQEFCAMAERHAETLKEPGRQADSVVTRM